MLATVFAFMFRKALCLQIFPLKGHLEAALAKIADLVEDDVEAQAATEKAIRQLQVTAPESPHLAYLLRLQHTWKN